MFFGFSWARLISYAYTTVSKWAGRYGITHQLPVFHSYSCFVKPAWICWSQTWMKGVLSTWRSTALKSSLWVDPGQSLETSCSYYSWTRDLQNSSTVKVPQMCLLVLDTDVQLSSSSWNPCQLPDHTKNPTCICLSQFISLLSKLLYCYATVPSNF